MSTAAVSTPAKILALLNDDPAAGLSATAALIRSRADEATGHRWEARGGGVHPWVALYSDEAEVPRQDSLPSMEAGGTASHADSQHIASWDPASAAKVADWLDVAHDSGTSSLTFHAARDFARTYLGGDA